MSTSTILLMRRIATITGLLGAFILVLGGFFIKGGNYYVSAVGAVIALAAWGVAVYISVRMSWLSWLVFQAYLAVMAIVLAISSLIGLKFADERLGAIFLLSFLPLTVGGFVIGAVQSEEAIARVVAAALGATGFVILIVGGTIVGDSVGAPQATYVLQNAIGDHMYVVTGVVGLATWAIGLMSAYRTKAWGWFTFALLLPGIGAFMFGLFGPSEQDVRQSHENTEARRAAGVRG